MGDGGVWLAVKDLAGWEGPETLELLEEESETAVGLAPRGQPASPSQAAACVALGDVHLAS